MAGYFHELDQAARTGSTKIGQYLINHSFFLPTVIAAVVSVGSGIIIAGLIFGWS